MSIYTRSITPAASRIYRVPLVVLTLSLLSICAYLLVSALIYRIGFPLDDAWIHQTYARNLGQLGEWAFVPGQPSAGSTAPLWSGLLAVGHALRLGPYAWTYFLGWTLLASLSLFCAWAFKVYNGSKPSWALWIGLLIIFEWHLVWASASGMETLLFALLVLIVLAWLAAGRERWLELGLVIGLSAWVRPDGVTLLAPAVLALFLAEASRRRSAFLRLCLGFLVLFGPYLLFNRLLAGAWWPNTFYAKQAEYAVLQKVPLVTRYLSQLQTLMHGVGVMFLPGFLIFSWNAARRRAWGALAGVAWLAGDLGLYAWRLPVTYQHGRYLIPVLPLYLVMGAAGMGEWLQVNSLHLWPRVFSRAWLAAAIVVLAVYWITGSAAYGGDVAFIESEMVPSAKWVKANASPGTLVAAHDIGALGYFGGHPILDLAGLVSPEVIPFIRDESRLEQYLDSQEVDYLVTFPGWYPSLAKRAVPIYVTGGSFSRKGGGENMVVYRWK